MTAYDDLDAAVVGVKQAAAADAQTIADQAAQNAALTQQVTDLEAELAARPPARHEVLMGLYGATNNEAGMEAADAKAGVFVPLSRSYYDLGTTSLYDPLKQEAAGRTLVLSLAPRDHASPPNWWTFASIRDGAHDADIARSGQLLASMKRKHYVGFAHEPETLAAQHGAGSLSDFVGAWEHVIAGWKAQGANHFWTCCFQAQVPLGGLPTTYDRIGCDPYCWYNVPGHMGPWVWPEPLLDNAIASATSRGDSTTPMLLCETGTGPDPRKGAWLTRLYLGALARPRMEAVCYFSTNKETDWRVDSDADSLAAWQAVMKAVTR